MKKYYPNTKILKMENNLITTEINNYIEETDWKVWVVYKDNIKENALKLSLEEYNKLIDYVFNLKWDLKWENKLKIFELWAMLSNNKIYIEK